MTEKIVNIANLRKQRERKRVKKAQTPAQVTSEPTRGQGGLRRAVEDYMRALESNDPEARADASKRIYAIRGNKGANTIAGIQIGHTVKKRAEIRSKLHVLKKED